VRIAEGVSSLRLAGGRTGTATLVHRFAANAPSGVYHVVYELEDASGRRLVPLTQRTADIGLVAVHARAARAEEPSKAREASR
jgi:hypothetical protein